jgi:hypothetical protein
MLPQTSAVMPDYPVLCWGDLGRAEEFETDAAAENCTHAAVRPLSFLSRRIQYDHSIQPEQTAWCKFDPPSTNQ